MSADERIRSSGKLVATQEDVIVPKRRELLRHGLAAAVVLAGPGLARAAQPGGLALARPAQTAVMAEPAELSFYNTHTGERLAVVYRDASGYLPDAMAAVAHVLRDHRNDQVKAIDPALLDQLQRISAALGTDEPFHVISGYRSPETNAKLAAASNGVARHSMHLEGRAIDIRLPDRPLAQLHRAALALRAGGVGAYPSSNFVHIDTGRVRTW